MPRIPYHRLVFLTTWALALAFTPLIAQLPPPQRTVWGEDHDGDGKDDHFFEDLDGDGKVDICRIDLDEDGKTEERWIDDDDDGDWDTRQSNPNDDDKFDSGRSDTNDDGKITRAELSKARLVRTLEDQ